jgi:U4/U6 small nuclear ribonucleoprotein PRP3
MASSTGKRQLPQDSGDGEAKRMRAHDGSPAPPAADGLADAGARARKLEEMRARVQASKRQSGQNGQNGQNGSPTPPAPAAAPPPPAAVAPPPARDQTALQAQASRKIAALKARIAQQRAGCPAQVSTPAPPPPSSNGVSDRMSEVQKRAAQVAARRKALEAAHAPPPPPPRTEGGITGKGLNVSLHPLFLEGTAQAKPAPAAVKKQSGPKVNPYLAAAAAAAAEHEAATQSNDAFAPVAMTKAGARKPRPLKLHGAGRFIEQAEKLRAAAKLEEMRKKIAAEARKVEIEEATDRAFLVKAPPDVEWWDKPMLNDDGSLLLEGEGSIITSLVQHPVILKAPQDTLLPPPKPIMLTQKEQKKLRRQRRMADMKEEQAKIRLGLVEPPPPKVKKSNMMRVLGDMAVKDPTAVEVRVNKEIAQRAADHAKANADRQLTKEQRAEKLKQKQEMDEARGVYIAAFRVDDLGSSKHRYQVDITAKQLGLTGIVVLHPTMNLIIVEGGVHSIAPYKKLMLKRIKWTENTLPLPPAASSTTTDKPTTFLGGNDGTAKAAEGKQENKAAKWITSTDEKGQLKDFSQNRCVLVFEGNEKNKAFKKWGSKAVESDGEAKDVLSRMKMEHLWTLARAYDQIS